MRKTFLLAASAVQLIPEIAPLVRARLAHEFTLIDLDEPWICIKDQLVSRSKNTPFENARFSGRAVATYVAGNLVFSLNWS